jgi:hypothetical protein
VSGFLVGRSDDSVLVTTTAEIVRLRELARSGYPRDQVREMSVGPSCPVRENALVAADTLAEELKRDEGDEGDEPITASLDDECK